MNDEALVLVAKIEMNGRHRHPTRRRVETLIRLARSHFSIDVVRVLTGSEAEKFLPERQSAESCRRRADGE